MFPCALDKVPDIEQGSRFGAGNDDIVEVSCHAVGIIHVHIDHLDEFPGTSLLPYSTASHPKRRAVVQISDR